MGDKRRLHIGGTKAKEGWEVFNIVPGPHVDFVGNAADMTRFPDNSFDVLYASHILEHFDYFQELNRVLQEWYRILKNGGMLCVSVPDLEVLGSLLADKTIPFKDTFMLMRMIFGGQSNPYDYHKVGFNSRILSWYLKRNGFVQIKKVNKFNYFNDTSNKVFNNKLISLNITAIKQHNP